MALKNFVQAAELSLTGVTALDGDFSPIIGSNLPAGCFLIRFINDSDTDVIISYDGDTDHDFLRAGETLEIYTQSNSQPSNHVSLFKAGTMVYLRGEAGTGTVYFSAYYQS